MIKVNDEVIVNMAPIIGSPERQPTGRYAKVMDVLCNRQNEVLQYWVCPEGNPPLWVDARWVSEPNMPRLTAQQQADDYFSANPGKWFVAFGGCMFSRKV